MIHCIGDSHSSVFSGNEEMQPIWPIRSNDITDYFKSYRIGPATAYQLENKIPLIDNIINTVVNPDDSVLFCFGEVDIRAHLIKQMELQNKSISEIVQECVHRYMLTVQRYKKNNVMVWGPIASWHDSKPYLGGPSFGTSEQRNETTKEFNRVLESYCKLLDIPFITIFDKMVDENNVTKPEYLDDWEDCHIHLNQKAMPLIIEAFKEKGFLKSNKILISHRGNINGPKPDLENSPNYINSALQLGFNVEIDVWFDQNRFFLGHDKPQYEIEEEYLEHNKLWCHAKNLEAFNKLLSNPKIHSFWHQQDNVTLTSKNYVWTYPGIYLIPNAIACMPETVKFPNLDDATGICSDYISIYK